MTGTQQGEFMGIPPTNKPVKVSYIDLWRVENGQFVENWVQMDMLGLMQQLGVVPAPEQASA
jgi:predicted ester cyclase